MNHWMALAVSLWSLIPSWAVAAPRAKNPVSALRMSKATAPYAQLFAEGACFNYRLSYHQVVRDDEESGGILEETKRDVEVRCRVASVKRFASGLAANVTCSGTQELASKLSGNPPIEPEISPARVYVATSKGLWWTDAMPRNARELKLVTGDGLHQLLASPLVERHRKNTEDEDVSYTTHIGAMDDGRWCWEFVERYDYSIADRLCFANGTLASATRTHVLEDVRTSGVYDRVEPNDAENDDPAELDRFVASLIAAINVHDWDHVMRFFARDYRREQFEGMMNGQRRWQFLIEALGLWNVCPDYTDTKKGPACLDRVRIHRAKRIEPPSGVGEDAGGRVWLEIQLVPENRRLEIEIQIEKLEPGQQRYGIFGAYG